MKRVNCISASESGFANGVPLAIEPHDMLDAMEIELRHSIAGANTAALQAMLNILEKSNGK